MTSRTKKLLIIGLAVVILVPAGGYVGYRAYLKTRQARLVSQAKLYLEKNDLKNALLLLQRALRHNAGDVEAARLMAGLAESSRSPAALMWRNRVVDLAPDSLTDRLALVNTALVMRDYATATNALDAVKPADRSSAAYHNVAGTAAIATGRFAEAERNFVEATRLDPSNQSVQMNLAVVRLRSTNSQDVATARVALNALRAGATNATLRCQALRELVGDAMRQQQTDVARALCTELVADTNAAFRDRLLQLDVLRESKDPSYPSALMALRKDAESEPARVYETVAWQAGRMSPRETLTWLQSLPLESQTNSPVNLLIAETQVAVEDWTGLQQFVQPQNWVELNFLRHAFMARALRGQGLDAASTAEWELALKAVNNHKQGLAILLRLASQFRWETEAEKILWQIVNQHPDEQWAYQALTQVLYANGRTRPLMTVFGQRAQRFPSELESKNNLVMTALLLDAQELKPHDLARQLYETAPTNAAYASTYAFSLHLQEKNDEALKIFEKLHPRDLENPSMAGYYGLVLKRAGNAEKARAYLEWAFKAPMLPEERKLFETARR